MCRCHHRVESCNSVEQNLLMRGPATAPDYQWGPKIIVWSNEPPMYVGKNSLECTNWWLLPRNSHTAYKHRNSTYTQTRGQPDILEHIKALIGSDVNTWVMNTITRHTWMYIPTYDCSHTVGVHTITHYTFLSRSWIQTCTGHLCIQQVLHIHRWPSLPCAERKVSWA